MVLAVWTAASVPVPPSFFVMALYAALCALSSVRYHLYAPFCMVLPTLSLSAVAVAGAYLFDIKQPSDDISLDLMPDKALHRAAVYCYIGQVQNYLLVPLFSCVFCLCTPRCAY